MEKSNDHALIAQIKEKYGTVVEFPHGTHIHVSYLSEIISLIRKELRKNR